MRTTRKPYVTEKKGRLYYRLTWTDNGKRRERYVPLPDDENSEEFDRAYWAIRSGKSEAVQPKVKTSWDALIIHYKKSPKYLRLADGTRRKYDAVMNALREKNGNKDICNVTRQQVLAIHEKYADTPRKADHYVQVIRILMKYAVQRLEWIDKNPAEGIELHGKQSEWQPWPSEIQKAYKTACENTGNTVALTAFYLGTLTGQRPGDLCDMQWSHYDGEYISVVQEKTDVRISIYCPDELREYLAKLPRQGRYILAKNLHEPLGYDAVYRQFTTARKLLGDKGKGFVMHGWRYTAAVALAESGCSDAEIQAVTGHKTLEMVQKYRANASQKRLSKSAQKRRGTNEG